MVCKINAKHHGNKKESKTTDSKKKKGKPKHSAFAKVKYDHKKSVGALD
jgi:hypothetical protein